MRVSTESKLAIEARLLIALLGLLAVLFYLLVSASTSRIGFPLDDAWIKEMTGKGMDGQGMFNTASELIKQYTK